MEFKNIGDMVEHVIGHIKEDRSEKEAYILMHVIAGPSTYLYRGSKNSVKTSFHIGTGSRGPKKYGCSRFKIDCAVFDEDKDIRSVYEIVKKEKLSPSYQKRFDAKKRMMWDMFNKPILAVTYREIDDSFKLWLFDEMMTHSCASDAYLSLIETIDDIGCKCTPDE